MKELSIEVFVEECLTSFDLLTQVQPCRKPQYGNLPGFRTDCRS